MALHIQETAASSVIVTNGSARSKQTHTKPRPTTHIDLNKPGFIRVGHMLTLFSVSHSTLYEHIKAGRIPKPDGRDGRPYWLTETVRQYLKG